MDGMIQTGRFCEFVNEFVTTTIEEKKENLHWEFFLHKVWEGTFNDFKQEIETNKQNQSMSDRAMETTIKHSMKILNNFNPEQGGDS